MVDHLQTVVNQIASHAAYDKDGAQVGEVQWMLSETRRAIEIAYLDYSKTKDPDTSRLVDTVYVSVVGLINKALRSKPTERKAAIAAAGAVRSTLQNSARPD